MVAVVILALAIFGIFHAYSVGFLGMADARDRTVAVNYIQKTLEEYKNKPFNKIIDKPMHQITGTKFSSGSIVIDMKKEGEETRLKKIITQLRWPARNGDIKIEEASMLIYNVEKTGEILSASEIVLYASPYFRILPNASTDLFAEIHDVNGNIVTNESYTVNFVILSGDTLGYLDSPSDDTTNGIASVKFFSNEDADGSVSVQASADLDDDGSDDVFDTITITISTGAEGIILVPSSDSSLAGTSVDIDLYIVDASFTYETEHIITGYNDPITLSATGPATLSVNTITAPDGKASFTLNSNGTPGTVEIIASAADLDLGYTKVTFTGGAQSIQLTPINGSIYEGENIEITITILDENSNPTPFTGGITITSNSGGSFTLENPIEFDNVSFRKVGFSHNVATEGIEINATGDGGLTSNTIYIDVLESLTPSYIELSAIPSNVEANGENYSFITATVYDDSDPAEIVTNYTTPITFSVSEDEGYFLDGETKIYNIDVTPSHGQAYINLYSDSGGIATVTATSGALTLDSINITFYSSASYIFLTTNPDSVVANGEDYAVITATVYDSNTPANIVTNYLYGVTFSVSGVGYLGDEDPITPTNGIAQVKLYSNEVGTATVDAYSDDLSQPLRLEAEAIDIAFTQPVEKNIILTTDPIERYSAGHGNDEYVKFYIEVIGSTINLNSMTISWDSSSSRNLLEIAIKSPDTETDYTPIVSTNSSSPYTTNVITQLYLGESAIRLKFSKSIAGKTIDMIFYDNEEPANSYPITSPMQIVVPN
ncbi:MAG: hypothetical protein DRP89_03700 [Candidatus Neomarinimicrobiota bacterium]|nr:MAG: hypothetical protein DRP89_03700 [Candidatus Neomarinimicrobiota bacterium]